MSKEKHSPIEPEGLPDQKEGNGLIFKPGDKINLNTGYSCDIGYVEKFENGIVYWRNDPNGRLYNTPIKDYNITIIKTAAPSEPSSKEQEAVGLLVEYEDWEAELISDNRCWEPEGMASYPRLTPELYEKMLALQDKRNKILNRFPELKNQNL